MRSTSQQVIFKYTANQRLHNNYKTILFVFAQHFYRMMNGIKVLSHPSYCFLLGILAISVASCECDSENSIELPDLEVTELTFSPANPTTTDIITFNATLVNIGEITADPSQSKFTIGGESASEIIESPELAPGEAFTISRNVTLDVAQHYQNTVIADINDAVEESREDNNIATLQYAVTQGESYTVGVFYYPWYHGSFHGGQYLREHLIPIQLPELGEYDDRDDLVLSQHMAWSQEAGIDLWVTSWWGPGSLEDGTLLNHILPHATSGDLKVALFYESAGRIQNFADQSNLAPDITYIAENYFKHPNYLHVDGKPVIFIYLTRVMGAQGTLTDIIGTIRTTATATGYEIFIAGDHAFGPPPSTADELVLLDAVFNYDIYGSMYDIYVGPGGTGFADQLLVDNYFTDQAGWKFMAESSGTHFIPSATPGYNDRAVREGHDPLSRKLTSTGDFGSLFRAMVRGSRELVDPAMGNMILITSWNEWHEDTQIEPLAVTPATSSDDSPATTDYTNGLEYEGYGMRYLDILSEEVKP